TSRCGKGAAASLGGVAEGASSHDGSTPASVGLMSPATLPHLLVLQPLTANAQPFYFNLNTAAFDALQRNSA
ncbi:phage tail protein, partial [Pseudomonas aeruginosa]|nr:phage tail protein [Pseudomonas aeruginosa]